MLVVAVLERVYNMHGDSFRMEIYWDPGVWNDIVMFLDTRNITSRRN
jgi:hypothetical protein